MFNAEELHDAADEVQAAAVEIMDCLHDWDRLDQIDREFAEDEVPRRVLKLKEKYNELLKWAI